MRAVRGIDGPGLLVAQELRDALGDLLDRVGS